MNITMRFSHLAACCLVALAPGFACAAISLAPPSLPPCAFADTESSSNFVFCTGIIAGDCPHMIYHKEPMT